MQEAVRLRGSDRRKSRAIFFLGDEPVKKITKLWDKSFGFFRKESLDSFPGNHYNFN
jgi:hypothetical protein